MATKRNLTSGRKGMQRDKHPAEVSKEEYTFMLNGNFQDEHGNGMVMLQNEPSNIKCTGFKPGYKVIGHKFDVNADKTYFFLVNPNTGCSEIGYIDSFYKADSLDAIESSCNCNIKVVLETPLEKTPQISICEYHTIISDFCESTGDCTGCLNFDIHYPIKENNIQIKTERTGTNIYFTDNLNPQRYLQLDNLSIYTQTEDPCDGSVITTCLQCDKLRIFPLHDKLCIIPRIIQSGGNLKAGVYEVVGAYSTITGEELSDYYSLTNPVHIFDLNNNILDQTNLDYITNQSIGFNISDLDSRYEYYKIAVINRSGLDGSVSVYEYGIYPIGTDRFTISTLVDKKRMQLDDIISRRIFYVKARGLTTGNRVLYHYGLTAHREINLQPIGNLLGAFVKWATVQANEDLYEDGVDISKYQSYMRDEVVPLGIKFYSDGGYELPLINLIARPPRDFEIEELGSGGFPSNQNTDSVLEYNPSCTENNRNKRWQFENTAEIIGRCEVDSPGTSETIVIREVESSCYVTDEAGDLEVLATIPNSSFQVDTEESIVDYINTHIQEIIDSTGPNGADIRDILSSPEDYPETCEPLFGDNCNEESIELVDEEMFAISVEVESTSIVDRDFSEYTRPNPPQTCNVYQMDGDNNIIVDQNFIDSYMNSDEVVYKKIANPTNMSCSSAISALDLTNPQIDLPLYLINKGEIAGISSLRTSLTASAVRTTHYLTLTGISGTADIAVGGIPYLATFATDLSTTAADFVTMHAAAILTADGTVVTNLGPVLIFVKQASISPTLSILNVSGTLDGDIESIQFTDKIHTNAIWVKLAFNGNDKVVFEITPTNCSNNDDNAGKSLRISSFEDCNATSDISTYGVIVDDMSISNDSQKFIVFNSADFGGVNSEFYVVMDSPIRTRMVEDSSSPGTFIQSNTLTPPCGCFGAYQRTAETITLIEYTNLTFGKKSNYKTLCEFTIPNLNGCDPIPYEYGLFSYWESEEKYPCNDELYDSTTLTISPSDIPSSIRDEFEGYFSDGLSGGNYILNLQTDFRDKSIRHYKFPDSRIVPFMSFNKQSENQDPGAFKKSMIYPIGFSIDNETINAFLDIAVKNGLITIQERSLINRYEIFRGDRRTDRSIIAKGILFDVLRYPDVGGDLAYYPNYPLNSLGRDEFNGLSDPSLYSNNGNTLFTFHSPETHFEKPTLPREISFEGYQFGKAAHYFDEVKGHSTYVLLGEKAYQTATSLAAAEVAFEVILQVGNWLTTGSAGGISVIVGVAAAVLAIAGMIVGGIFRAGEKRYKWLQTYINLGKPNNFAYYQVAIGHYGVFLPTPDINQTLRGISTITYIRPGRVEVTDEVTNDSININNVDREDSVFISLGKAQHIVNYPTEYKNYDNCSFSPPTASRRGYSGTGRSPRIVSNAASMYASLKQYLPSQYGSIYSIDWLNTGFCGNLNENSQCDPIFGGDTYISRFALKRKLPFFTSNAVNEAPLVPFAYSDYFNVNPIFRTSGYFLDYLINDDANNYVSMIVFPTPKSTFLLDPIGLNTDVFYIKPPAKFYLFSYGIPYFLVESSINCNYRVAHREAFENFYPNVGDVIDWTQEKKVSIKQPNTYFYNTVYSSEHSKYPWRVLPVNYSKELYEKLDNLENSAIFSKEDNSENGLIDPWLLYKALDFFNFQKDYGRLIDMRGIESEQILARFTNGFAILGSIDKIRDRLTPEGERLGGSPFDGRTINFNKTELGYAGTQHSMSVSCEFGTFWPDAKRGKVFNLKPNGSGLSEITIGVEKWFKENLPFKILGSIPGLTDMDLDNNYIGLGISMGWDDRLKRVFLTKKDYIPLVDGIQYQPGIGFYTGDFQPCPEGYTDEGEFCVKETIIDKVPTSQIINLEKVGTNSHGYATPALYSVYNSDGSANVDGLSPTGYTYENLTDTFWTGDGVVADRFVVRLAKWVVGGLLNVWYGFSTLLEVENDGTYYIAIAADNLFRITLNGVMILESDTDTMGPQHGLSAPQYPVIPFIKVHIYPIELKAGCNILKVEGLNEGGAGLFSAAILDNTAQELRDANSMNDLNFIFSTETTDVFYLDASEYECPEGSTPIGDGPCSKCLLIESIPHPNGITLVDLNNIMYFKECSFTIAYSPLTEMWISYYSFKPNYYVSYNDYFQTGLNYSSTDEQIGLWSHFSFLSSYQVFYGVLHPWIIEYPLVSNAMNSSLEDIQYFLDVRKYYNKYNFANILGHSFNKAWVYNDQQNSGQLELVVEEDNDLSQMLTYPKHNADSIEILQTEINGKFSFNYLYNIIKNEKSGLPIWLYDCNQIEKSLNDHLLNYEDIYKDYLRGDYFLVRLQQDLESRFKMIFRFAFDDRNYYDQ